MDLTQLLLKVVVLTLCRGFSFTAMVISTLRRMLFVESAFEVKKVPILHLDIKI